MNWLNICRIISHLLSGKLEIRLSVALFFVIKNYNFLHRLTKSPRDYKIVCKWWIERIIHSSQKQTN